MISKKLIIAATICNNEQIVKDIFLNIKKLGDLFSETRLIIIESNSYDNTIKAVQENKAYSVTLN